MIMIDYIYVSSVFRYDIFRIVIALFVCMFANLIFQCPDLEWWEHVGKPISDVGSFRQANAFLIGTLLKPGRYSTMVHLLKELKQ